MNRERCEQWEAAFAKQERGETISNEEHMALVPRGLFEGMDGVVEACDEAEKVLRYYLHGFDLTPIAPRGPAIRDNWFALGPTFGEHRADEGLRNYIKASTRDPDYWEALTVIAARFHRKRQPLPDTLADWVADFLEGKRQAPPSHRGHMGRPYYANANRDYWIAWMMDLLHFLGMKEKDRRYSAIADALDMKEEAVRSALDSYCQNHDGKIPRPWECWPPPSRKSKRRE